MKLVITGQTNASGRAHVAAADLGPSAPDNDAKKFKTILLKYFFIKTV
jgi:hypothetical protein